MSKSWIYLIDIKTIVRFYNIFFDYQINLKVKFCYSAFYVIHVFLVEVEIYYLATINKPRAKFDVEQSE